MVLWLTADTADRWGVSGRIWLLLQTAMSGFCSMHRLYLICFF